MRSVAPVLALTLGLGFAPSPAAAAIALRATEEPSEDPAEQAQKAFERGQVLYSASSYNDAIEAFMEAFTAAARIDDPDFRDQVLAAILFNMARAHLKAYRLDDDPSHLRTAHDQLQNYIGATGSQDEQVTGVLSEIDAELAKLETDKEVTSAPEPAPTEEAPQEGPEEAPTVEPEPNNAKPGRPLMIGGAAALGLGGAGVAILGVGLAQAGAAERDYVDATDPNERPAIDQRGQQANTLAVVGGIVSGVGLVAGASLLALGMKKNKDAERTLSHRVQLGAGVGGWELSF